MELCIQLVQCGPKMGAVRDDLAFASRGKALRNRSPGDRNTVTANEANIDH
jgi:hypothetical protein